MPKLDNWIILYIFLEIKLIKELGYDTNLNIFNNSTQDVLGSKKINIDQYTYDVPNFLIEQKVPNNITKLLKQTIRLYIL